MPFWLYFQYMHWPWYPFAALTQLTISFNDSFATTLTAASYKKMPKAAIWLWHNSAFWGYAHVRTTFPANENEHMFLCFLLDLFIVLVLITLETNYLNILKCVKNQIYASLLEGTVPATKRKIIYVNIIQFWFYFFLQQFSKCFAYIQKDLF